MKKTLLMTGALLALTAGIASAAAGINLSWNDCGSFGVVQKNFACNANTGSSHILYASAITGVDMAQLNGQAGVLDLQVNTASLPNWWQFNSGGCRFNSPSFLSANFDFTAASGNCFDPWLGGAAGGINYTPGFNGANRARIRTVCAIPGSTGINGTDEYYFFKVSYGNARTTGTGSCAGCQDGACIVFNSILVTQPAGVGDYTVSTPILRNWAQWQGGATGVSGGCPQATPTKSATWGSVKSLYR